MTRIALPIAFAFVLVACGGAPPKPRELETLQELRGQAVAERAAEQDPELVGEADHLRRKSEASWKGGHIERAKREALMGWIKLKTAVARLQQKEAKAKLAKLDKEQAKAEKKLAKLKEEHNQLSEQVALLEKLQEAQTAASTEREKAAAEKAALSEKLTKEQQKAAAQKQVAEAELALKTADTVLAAELAAATYRIAVEHLARAQAELKKGDYQSALVSAELASTKAKEAEVAAKPKFDKQAAARDRKAMNDALASDAAGISGVSVRVEKRGDVTRLILPLHEMFAGARTAIRANKRKLLDEVAALLKKYPDYPVQIVGYTDNRGRSGRLVARSLARAHSVFEALVDRGVDAKRFVVSGKGPESPVASNRSRAGRAKNNRVEVVFLYQ